MEIYGDFEFNFIDLSGLENHFCRVICYVESFYGLFYGLFMVPVKHQLAYAWCTENFFMEFYGAILSPVCHLKLFLWSLMEFNRENLVN